MADAVNMFVDGIRDVVVSNSMDVFYAFVILVVGYFVAVVSGYVSRRALVGLKVDRYVRDKGKIPLRVSSVAGTLVKWYLILIVIHVAVCQMGRLESVAVQLQNVIGFVPTIVAAGIVLLLSYVIGIYVKEDVFGDKEIHSSIIGQGLFFLVMFVGFVMSLSIINIDTFLISAIVLVILASVGLGVGIALGLGLKDTVAVLAGDYVKKYRKK
ncbi:MAG: hypothetical protein KAH93_01645 [Candidatus Aenigmarchaeota archaeon]|nr:hypothetical protein [Candidatus Aenigmarchaeota archaeon]